mmetsp:Transcript_20385/g.44043  ORF Transcript_20385/g.44043 Transcript_20385/m.44043 type:complete len:677 (+) Transcript_20385:174-2204(+)
MGCAQSTEAVSAALHDTKNGEAPTRAPSPCCSETSSDVVTRVKKDIDESCDLIQKIVRMETQNGTPIDEVYAGVHDGKVLGEGAGGVVRKVTHRATQIPFAVKCLNKDKANTEKGLKQLRDEITLMCEISHPNVVRIEEVYESPTEIFIVQELLSGGDLFDRLEEKTDCRYTESHCAKLVSQMLSAVCYLHKTGIAHLDLKLENFLFTSADPNSELRLIDFGLSKHFQMGEHHCDMVGTPYTVAPEVINGDYTEKADIWSLGVITFLLLCGESPFGGDCKGDDLKGVTKRILTSDYGFEGWDNVSDSAKGFVKRLLNPDPHLRPTAKEAQNDPWLLNMADESTHDGSHLLNPETVTALLAYRDCSELQKLLSAVLSFTLLPEQISALRHEFELVDIQGDGEISLDALKAVLAERLDARTLEDIFDCVKIRKSSSTLRYHEFLAAVLSRIQLDDRNIRLAFDRLDCKHKGFLTLDDLLDLLGDSVDQDEFKRTWMCSLEDSNTYQGKITIFDIKNLIRGHARAALSTLTDGPVNELENLAPFSAILDEATRAARSSPGTGAERPIRTCGPRRSFEASIGSTASIDERETREKLFRILEMRLSVQEASRLFEEKLKARRQLAFASEGAGLVSTGKEHSQNTGTTVQQEGSNGTVPRRPRRRRALSCLAGMANQEKSNN